MLNRLRPPGADSFCLFLLSRPVQSIMCLGRQMPPSSRLFPALRPRQCQEGAADATEPQHGHRPSPSVRVPSLPFWRAGSGGGRAPCPSRWMGMPLPGGPDICSKSLSCKAGGLPETMGALGGGTGGARVCGVSWGGVSLPSLNDVPGASPAPIS